MMNLKEAIKYVFEIGQHEQRQHRDEISEISPGLYANMEGQLAVALNKEIERRNRKPNDVERRDVTTDVESFVALIKRHKTETTEVFVGEDAAVAVLQVDGWRRHTIALPLERSESWRFWAQQASRPVADVADDVAAHVDDVAGEGVSGEQLLKCLSGIEWTSEDSTRVSHSMTGLKITQSSGERVADLPGLFAVHIRVYEFEDVLHPIRVRLTARKTGDGRVIVFTPISVNQVKRKARGMLLTVIREGLGDVPVFAGGAQLYLDR